MTVYTLNNYGCVICHLLNKNSLAFVKTINLTELILLPFIVMRFHYYECNVYSQKSVIVRFYCMRYYEVCSHMAIQIQLCLV